MTFARRALVIFALVVLALMAGLAVATQDVAGVLHFPQAFGSGLANIGPLRLYPPWAFADWYLRDARSQPRVFEEAGLWGLLAALVPVMLAIFVGVTRSANRSSPNARIMQEAIMPIQSVQAVRRDWRNVLPAAAPGASQGTPYSFWVKQGDPTKLAVILSGGGACWTGENCALHCRPHYRAFAGLEQDPSGLGGIFDTDNPENPLANHTLVYLPTANGDVFLGDATPVYDTPAMNGHPESKVKILHKGFDNAMLALDWMFKAYPQPNAVAVMGWSAGALASPLYTHIVARHYSGARVTHFADGGGAYHLSEKLTPLFKSWGTENVLKRVEGFEDLPINGLAIEDLYIRAARLHPDIVFHQYNERHDAVQAMFMQLIGEKRPDVPAKLDEAHAYIRARVPNFRTYTSWGRDEGIIGGYYDAVLAANALDNRGRPHVLDRFYTRQTNGVRFLDWFTAAVTGKSVEDVACIDCKTPEYHWNRPAFPQ
ncbi:MAG TPA: hypothetical protein VMH86_10285 [Rhizomicrobium sp.]|nr:hypothetical protein [Rhizomicrobium sp.]